MGLKVHEVQPFQNEQHQWGWRVVVLPQPSDVEQAPTVVAESPVLHTEKSAMMAAFFGVFFGDYNDSFLALYNEWHPEMGQYDADQMPAVEPLGG